MKKLITSILLFSFIFISGCSGGSSFEFTGKVSSYSLHGMKCWYAVDVETGFYYELITSDAHLLTDGMKAKMKARPTERETICNMKDRIEIVSYKVY